MGGYDPGPGFQEGSPFNQQRGSRRHKGVDFPAAQDTVIPCAAVGVVVGRGSHSEFGNTAIVKHDDPMSSNDKYTLYAHQPDLDDIPAIGTQVNKGDKIGRVGSTGRSTGPHLHMELISLPAGSWWSQNNPWRGGATGITGSTGRIDPLNATNWGGLDVYGGGTDVGSLDRNRGAPASELCMLGCDGFSIV